MAQYIDKDALVAEVERMMAEEIALFEESLKDGSHEVSAAPVAYTRLQMLLSAINTIEVKEVDFEKKKIEWIEQLCKYFKANYLYVSGHESFISDFRRYAKDLK